MAEGSVYSNNSSIYDLNEEMNTAILSSEYLNNLIEPIFTEFQQIVLNYGEAVVKNLMPLVGSSLDTLNRLYTEKHNLEIEFHLLKEDSSELMIQYEKEKILRRKTDERLIKMEDSLTESVSQYEDKIQLLESKLKMYEIRNKNMQEQIYRLEERETERKQDTEKVYNRYQELMKIHIEYMEKSKGSFSETMRSSIALNNPHSENISAGDQERNHYDFGMENHDNLEETDKLSVGSEDMDIEELQTPFGEELSGMTNEIEYLIKENDELTTTKNALNIVKDDLITKLDEANSEIEVLQHQNETLNSYKISLRIRTNELEQECKNLKQENTKLKTRIENNEEDENIPISQRKRFTRLEMARVLMERNHFKEKLNEMEEYVRWYKYINSKERKLTFWERVSKFLKNQKKSTEVVVPTTPPPPNLSQSLKTDVSSKCSALQDDKRDQSCGWSLPITDNGTPVSVPIPIFCKPILEDNPEFKIVCATTVNYACGKSKQGNLYIGESIFYKQSITIMNKNVSEANLKPEVVPINNPSTNEEHFYESHFWIAATSINQSQIIIIDTNKPTDIIDTFIIPNSVIKCLTSVPNCEDDVEEEKSLSQLEEQHKEDDLDYSKSQSIRLVKCISYSSLGSPTEEIKADQGAEFTDDISTPQTSIWIGCEDGNLYIHPAVGRRSQCYKHIQLPDAITNILYRRSRIFVSLANGKIVVFSKYNDTNHLNDLISQWNISEYLLIEKSDLSFSIRSLVGVTVDNIWISYKNSIMVMNDKTLKEVRRFQAHSMEEYYIRYMCCVGDGVWISFRMDVELKLYHRLTYQLLQSLSLESHINKLIEPSLIGLTLLRITCIYAVENTLWIGINNGMILSAPFSRAAMDNYQFITCGSETDENLSEIGSCLRPNIQSDEIQLSYHGHKDDVKFFLSFHRNSQMCQLSSTDVVVKRLIIMSGGEGYRDFRLSENAPNTLLRSLTDANEQYSQYIILWQL